MPGLPSFSCRPIPVSLKDIIRVVGWDGLSFFQQLEVVQEGIGYQLLGEESIDNHSGTDENTFEVLVHGKRDEHEGFSSDLDDDDLEDEDTGHDEEEEIVIEEVFKDIKLLLLELTSVEKVEDLQEDKDIEEDTQVLSVGLVPLIHSQAQRTRHAEDLVTFEEYNVQDCDLVDRTEDDASPHLRVDDVLAAGVRHAVQEVIRGRLGRQGEGG